MFNTYLSPRPHKRSFYSSSVFPFIGGISVILTSCCCLGPPTKPVFDAARLDEIDHAIQQAIADHKIPGGVFWLEKDKTIYSKAYGYQAIVPTNELCHAQTIFDAASLTKVIATVPAIALLIEQERVDIEAPACRYLPEFRGDERTNITIRHLLTHTSGLRPGISLKPKWEGYAHGIQLACQEKPSNPPGEVFRYSDINYILLGEIVRRVSGKGLNEYVAENLYVPLGMFDTGFLPSPEKLPRIAPTQIVDDHLLRGVVHDPTSRCMGGVAGHAGLFTTAGDLARFARMLLNQGVLDGVRVLRPETIQRMCSVQSPAAVEARRGWGWDIDSGYSRPRGDIFPLGSFGHTGWTGTCIWIDPFSKTFWMFLSNRVHPDGRGNVLPLQSRLGTLAAQAVLNYDFAQVDGALPPRIQKTTAD